MTSTVKGTKRAAVTAAGPPKCVSCNHVPHPNGECNVGTCDCTESLTEKDKAKDEEAADDTTLGAIASHSTDTSDGAWDSGKAEKNLPADDAATLRKAYAWVDPAGDPAAKASYRFIHHEVAADGTVGAANLTACSTGIGVLNGGRGGTTIPRADYDGVYNHLARHITDSGADAPEKKYSQGDGGSGGNTAFAKTKDQPDPAPQADPVTGTPFKRWRMPVAVLEGVQTGDRRKIAAEALSWRELPQPLMANTTTTVGHDGAELVGRIDEAKRVDAASMVDARTGKPYGKGVYAVELSGVFTSEEQASRVNSLIKGRFLRGVSVDLSDVESEIEYVDKESGEVQEIEDPIEGLFFDGDMVETVTAGRIMGCTINPFPAFEGAYIELLDDDGNVGPSTQPARPTAAEQRHGLVIHNTFRSRECAPCVNGEGLTAGAGPQFPPQAWFVDPKLPGPTPLTVLDDGRVFGHLALWDTCHTGYAGQCVKAPHSNTNYALFKTGAVKVAEGQLVPVGQITMDTKHAGLRQTRFEVARHYDHTGSAVADIVAGEDEHGVWVAGALRPDVTDSQVRTLRASSLSGDWREHGGNLELLATLAVNVPGFPVVRELVAAGMPLALVASAAALRQPESLANEMAQLQQYLPELMMMREKRLAETRTRMAASRRAVAAARIAAATAAGQ
jgi:hypothetical protein